MYLNEKSFKHCLGKFGQKLRESRIIEGFEIASADSCTEGSLLHRAHLVLRINRVLLLVVPTTKSSQDPSEPITVFQ
jgi:hypothetical protein